MRRTDWRAPLALTLTLVVGCDVGGPGRDVVAEAEDMELTVEQTTELLGSQPSIPAEPQVVQALADLWIDYTLLAVAAEEDSTLSHLDLSALLRQREEQQMIQRLRESVLADVDTTVTDEELERLWEDEAPGVRVRARHILLSVPEDADQARLDSINDLAEELTERIRGGEDFAELAREHSDDPGSAAQGGDLGFFAQGEMVAGFEEAAFRLEPGEVSDPVRTPFGVHVIRVEERETPSLDMVRDRFREQVQQQRVVRAESVYVAGLPALESVQVQEGATEVVRELARDPGRSLSRRASNRALVAYEGGEVTAAEFQEFLRHRPPGIRTQIEQAPDAQLQGFLENLARTEILVEAAREGGHGLTESERDSLGVQARSRVLEATRTLGLMNVTPGEDESLEEAIQRVVLDYLGGVLQGTRDVIPLGGISYALREEYEAEVNEEAIERVAESLGDRGQGAEPGLPTTPPGGTMPAPGDQGTPQGAPGAAPEEVPPPDGTSSQPEGGATPGPGGG